MPYKVSYHSSLAKDLKAFKKSRPIKELIQLKMEEVIKNPDIGAVYEHNIAGIYKLRFEYDKTSYRLLYKKYACCKTTDLTVCPFEENEGMKDDECQGGVDFLFVRTRDNCDNLYKKDAAYFDNKSIPGMEIL